MSEVILNPNQDSLLVVCAGTTYKVSEGEDGSLHIEEFNAQGLAVAISDEEDEEVAARGVWVNICVSERAEE